jgi:predicted RecB family nuclease
LRREEVLQVAWSRKDLTLIFGIGRPYAAALEEMGVSDYEALLSHEPDALVSGLRERGYFVSAATVESWQRHAQSWTNQAPVYFGKGPFFEGDSFIALDLEYDPLEGLIWLLGTCIVRGERRDYEALWADDRSTASGRSAPSATVWRPTQCTGSADGSTTQRGRPSSATNSSTTTATTWTR